MNTTMPALPEVYRGQKIDRYGLKDRVMELLMTNVPKYHIVEMINRECPEVKLSIQTLTSWLAHQSEEIRRAIKESQYKELLEQVWDWERQGISVRNEAMDEIKALLKGYDVDSIEDLKPHERAEVAKIIKAKLAVQKSGEDFMGISAKDGKRYDVNVTVKVDVIDQLRDKLKGKIIDVEVEEGEGESE